MIVLTKEVSLYGNFLGEDDDWKNNKDMNFWTKDKIMEFFKDYKIFYYAEKKYIKDCAVQKNKNWHVFEVYAQKANQ
jgi:hypothetical protein